MCDRDRFKSVYLGQVRLPADELFGETDPIAYDQAEVNWRVRDTRRCCVTPPLLADTHM